MTSDIGNWCWNLFQNIQQNKYTSMYKFTIIVYKQLTPGTKAQQNLDFLKPIQNYQMLEIRNTVKYFELEIIFKYF